MHQYSPACIEVVSTLTNMGIVTEFREIGVKGYTMVTQM